MSTSTSEQSYPNLLQGVSQQHPRFRLPGQVQAQLNTLSDLVTGVRRRPGAEYATHLIRPAATTDSLVAHYTEVAGRPVHVLLNCADGQITVLDTAHAVLGTVAGGAYLTAANKGDIRFATVGDELFIANVSKKPALGAASSNPDPAMRGFFYIVAGAFSKEFTVTVTTGTGSITASYTTPTGSAPGDAALATPSHIATTLRNSLDAVKATAGLTTVSVVDAYVYVQAAPGTTNVVVSSSSGSAYLMPSRDSYVTTQGNLAPRLPAAADDYIVRVGDVRSPQYFRYDATTQAWLEDGAYGSPASVTNVPVALTYNGTSWVLVTTAFEGRLAGDDESNPPHRFMTEGITGLSSVQGRLCILSGPVVSLSASLKPRRFWRSTVTTILDSDAIEVGSGANTSAEYSYAVQFNRDLILLSKAHQAVLPAGNVLTPRNANVVPASTHACDTSCPPLLAGRTLMYPVPRSADFFGVFEMVPSQYTDSQYTSQDTTSHIPKYMGGRCRFTASSGVSGLALFGPTGDKYSMVVHEYVWSSQEKQQQAWHTWTFKHEIAAAYFSNEIINLWFVQNGVAVLATIDPRIGAVNANAERRPFLDLFFPATITDHLITVPAWVTDFDPDALVGLQVAHLTGPLASSKVGVSVDGENLRTVRSQPSGTVGVGWTFRSMLAPSPPVARDYQGNSIVTGKYTIQRFTVSTQNSSPFWVLVTDTADPADDVELPFGPLLWSSEELQLGETPEAGDARTVVPARVRAPSCVMQLYTEGTGEMNITGIDYVGRLSLKFKRR